MVSIIKLDTVDSTNRFAKQYNEKKHLLTIVADTQTGGRGRVGREFYSYNGGLYMSVIIDPSEINVPFHIVTPAAALAVRNTLVEYGVIQAKIKWVNDIYLDGKKICGILTEAKSEDNKIDRIVVGIGINLFSENTRFPEELQVKAGYVKIDANKESVAQKIAEKLGDYLKKTKEKIAEEYGRELLYLGQRVTLTDYSENTQIAAKVLGINEDCFLKIEFDDKTVKYLSSGEIV